MPNHYCPLCQKEVNFWSNYRELVNSKEKIHWFVTYCPTCGTIIDKEEEPFSSQNLIPRIGRTKSFLFILLISLAHQVLAWTIGGPIVGPIVTLGTLVLAYFVSKGGVYEVTECKYIMGKQYKDLSGVN